MPIPIPSPSPTPPGLPVVTARSFVDDLFDLPLLRHLPFQSTLKTAVDLFLLTTLFLLLRGVTQRLVHSGIEKMAHRAEHSGDWNRSARVRTLGALGTSIALYTLGFIFLVSALTVIGFPVASLIASAGVAGVAVGFGAQKLVKDVLTGFFILLEDQYAVGDYITVNGITAMVEDFALRTTRLRDDDGKLYILSNGDIAQVCNQSRGPVAGSFDIAIATTADIARATEVLDEALAKKSEEMGLADPAKVRGVSAVEAAKTTLSVSFRVAQGSRPGPAVYILREEARNALIQAQIPLG